MVDEAIRCSLATKKIRLAHMLVFAEQLLSSTHWAMACSSFHQFDDIRFIIDTSFDPRIGSRIATGMLAIFSQVSKAQRSGDRPREVRAGLQMRSPNA